MSWWIGVPRDGFTALAETKLPEMRAGKFGSMRAVDAEISAARGWGWGVKGPAKAERDDEAA